LSDPRKAVGVIRRVLDMTWARVRAVKRDQWFLLLFALLFLTFFVVLLFEPTVGRGGR